MLQNMEITPKEVYLNKLQYQSEVAKQMIDFTNNHFEAFLSKWDNKVYNKRFCNALEEELLNKIPFLGKIYIREYHNSLDFKLLTLAYANEHTRNQYEEYLYFKINIKDKRILANETFDYFKKNYLNSQYARIENYVDLQENYDEYMKFAREILIKLEEFRKIPVSFRANIKTMRS